MTQVKLVKLKFKENGKKIWLDWSEELKRRKDEVIETLKNEGVVSESCFISEDGGSVYYFMEAEDFYKAKNAFSTSTHPIDADHKKAREMSLEKIGNLECLFHFENREKSKL
jgi:L-rhamnose mutarotase